MMDSTEFLTPEECAEVDQALMTSREKFSARVAIYALRSLKQIAAQANKRIDELEPQQVIDWVAQDQALMNNPKMDADFRGFFAQLVISSFKPLKQVSAMCGVAIDQLTVKQVVAWFEQEAKGRLEQEM